MGEIENRSIRTEIMELFKINLSNKPFWLQIEAPLALKCAELIEPINNERREEFIQQLKLIKTNLLDIKISSKDLRFFDEEIELQEDTRMISLYEETEDSLDPSIISGYSRLGKGSEGIVAIPQAYNYAQLSKLTNGVFQETGLVKFYISNERTVHGKIIAEIYEQAQEIPIAMVIESKKTDKETGEKFKGIKLFGEKFSKSECNILKEINFPFYVYRFITEKNKELILITSKQCEIGDYIISGVQTQCDDNKMLTDSARLPTKLPFFFVQKIKNRIIKFKNHREFKHKLKNLKTDKENLFEYPFAINKGNKSWKLLHPNWYKWLIWSWLTHEEKGLMNTYPLHIMIIGLPGAGKSFLLNGLFKKSKETREIFSGSGSTLKSLVPSFKGSPAKLGYLAESNRFSFCDEFLRCLVNSRTTKGGSEREEGVAIMNDLLEHQKREVGSGVSSVRVNMTSRVIAATNPIRGVKNVEDLINIYDASFLSRWLIYYQTEDHVKLVRGSNDSKLESYNFEMPLNDWISILDYLQSFSAKYDLKKLEEIHKSVPGLLSENLSKHYDTRHKHHIECLMDGIIKTRCVLEQDMGFEAKEEDYKILKEVWSNIIRSWLNAAQIKFIDIKDRIFYLPEFCQYLYWKICEQKKKVHTREIKETVKDHMSNPELSEAWNILKEMGLIIEFDEWVKPHYFHEDEDDNQKRL